MTNLLTRFTKKLYTSALILENLSVYRRGISVYDYQRYRGSWLSDAGIGTVLDIGANRGESSLLFRQLLPDATIHAFEPLPHSFAQLQKATKGDSGIVCHNLAISDANGEIEFQENAFSQSSSLLELADAHSSAFPFAKNVTKIRVRSSTLDAIADEISPRQNILIKIDTQGAEAKVIAGGQKSLHRAHLIIIELSFVEMYKGQALFSEMFDTLRGLGFQLTGIIDVMRDPTTGAPLQVDAVFTNTIGDSVV